MLADIDWQKVLGPSLAGLDSEELTDFHSAVLAHAPRAIRVANSQVTASLPFSTQPVDWYASGFIVDGNARPGMFIHYPAGDYYIQDAGSMLALALCEIQPGQAVLDACSAPGGKATGLLAQLDGTGFLVSNEVIKSRLPVLQDALANQGYDNYAVTHADLEELNARCDSIFDCVLVDAPCTGQSMLAKGKQTLAAFSSGQIEHSSQRQERILNAASKLVRPGGRLVYSTCSFSWDENEAIVSSFLKSHGNFQSIEIPALQPWHSDSVAGCYRLWPHRHPTSGAFAAVMLKHESDPEQTNEHSRRARRQPQHKTIKESSLGLPVRLLPQHQLYRAKDTVFLVSEHRPASLKDIGYLGIPIAKQRSSRWEPLHPLARLQCLRQQECSRVTLQDTEACLYVEGQSLRLPDLVGKGWQLIEWSGKTLGWAKVSNGVVKNHFPKSCRQQVVASRVDE